MTINNETIQEEGNSGDHRYVITEIDITSLESAGTESYDPSSRIGLEGVEGVTVLDQENGQHEFRFDEDNNNIEVYDRGPRVQQKSEDPASQTYSGSSETSLVTYDPGSQSRLYPLNFNPADPTDADLSIVLRAHFHDGTTTDIISEAGGTEQSFENLVDGFATGDDDKQIDQLEVLVDNTGTDVTEDIGATTTEFLAYDADTPNNTDVGTVTMEFRGDYAV